VLTLPQAIALNNKEASFDPNATYLLSGGLGGLGRNISRWMTDRGARNLVFVSRSGDKNSEANEFLQSLRNEGINAVVYACDIGNRVDVAAVFERCRAEMPPIKGAIQAAMSLADAAFTNMTPEQWTLSVNPKAPGAWNLHKNLPKDLDFFVMLSSSSGIAGTRGQANYAAGNTFLDALAHYRVSCGLKAVSINVGPVLVTGVRVLFFIHRYIPSSTS
jgi:NAD(P)-dependent dehydrogenase (short-subunit alcohol dehydrogenase family)